MLNEKNSVLGTVLGISVRFIIDLMIIFLMYEMLVYSYTFSYSLFTDAPYLAGNTNNITITIEPEQSVFDMAEILYENRIVENKYLFVARAYVGKYNTKLRAGKYTLNSTMSPDTICRKMCGIQSEETQ